MSLRNFGLITEKEYVGRTLQESTKYAEDGGFITRVVETDGNQVMLDMSNREDRINFRVKNGFVISAFGG